MKTPTNGHSSRKPGDDRKPELPKRWLDVPVDALWHFTVELVSRYALRGVARMTGLGVETVRKFTLRAGEPNLATRRRFAELFLNIHTEAHVEKDENETYRVRPRLLTLLPEGRLEARAALMKIFAVAQRFPDELPYRLEELHLWMDQQITAEYNAEEHFGAIARGERDHEPGTIFARKATKRRTRRAPASRDDE